MTVKYIPFESKSGFKSPGFLVGPTGEITGASLTLSNDLDVQNIIIGGIELISGLDSTISFGEGIKNSYLEKVGTLQYLNIDGDFTVSQSSTPYISVINGEVRIYNPEDIGYQLYEDISQTTTGVINNNTGSGASFNITRNNSVYSVTLITPGIEFDINQTIIIPGTLLGGETPANDLIITITSILDSPEDFLGINSVSATGIAVASSTGSMNNIAVGLSVPASGKFTELTVTGNLSILGIINSDVSITGNSSVAGTLSVTGSSQFTSVSIETAPTEVYHATRKDYVDQRISAFSIAFGG